MSGLTSGSSVAGQPITVSHQISQLKTESSSIKTEVLKEGDKVIVGINAKIRVLEEHGRVGDPTSAIGRFFAPMKHKEAINEKKLALREIVKLHIALEKTNDLAEIDKLSRAIMAKIKNQEGTDPSKSESLTGRIEAVKTQYNDMLTTAGARLDTISNQFPNSNKSKSAQATSRKIDTLRTSIKGMEKGEIVSTKQLDKIEKDFDKFTLEAEIALNPSKAMTAQTEIISQLRKQASELQLPDTYKNHISKEIESKSKKLETLTKFRGELNLSQIGQLANLQTELKLFQNDLEQAKQNHLAASEAFKALKANGPDEQNIPNEFHNNLADINQYALTQSSRAKTFNNDDLFFSGTVGKSLQKNHDKFTKRHKDIVKHYKNDMDNARNASDFKKIAERCQQLKEDVASTKEIGAKLDKEIPTASGAWIDFQYAIKPTQGTDFEKNLKKQPIDDFKKKATLLKKSANSDLNSYSLSLVKFTNEVKSFDTKTFITDVSSRNEADRMRQIQLNRAADNLKFFE